MRRLTIFLVILGSILLLVSAYLFFKKTEPITEIVLYGNVDVRQVDLGFRVSGRVVSMPFQEGDYITPNTLLATLDKQPYLDEVRKAKAAVQSARASLKNTKLILARRKMLLPLKGVSQEDYDIAQSNYDIARATLAEAKADLGISLTNLRDIKVYAPNEGVILTRIREPGTVVKEADPVYTLSLTDPVWIRAFVSEPQLGLIYPGMKAEIHTDSQGVYKGHIGFISPVAEFTPKTVQTTELRTQLVYRLRIIADNPDKGLRQGMPVTVTLPLHRDDRGS